MRKPTGWAGRTLVTVAVAAALLAFGCTAEEIPPRGDTSAASLAEARGLRPVSLPDFSQMTESDSLREQLRGQYSALTSKLADPQVSDVDLSHAYGDMGKLLMAAKYFDAAAGFYLNAQTLAPDEMRWPYYLGHLHKASGALAEAAVFFELALERRPDDLATLVWLGEVRLSEARADEAGALFQQALSLDADSVAARAGLGRAALARHDYRDAVEHLAAAIALDPQTAGIHYPLALAYRGAGDRENAETHFRQRSSGAIVPADPLMEELEHLVHSAIAYEVRGTRALNTGDISTAAELFREGLELEPANPSLLHKLGTALFITGDESRAAEHFERAVRADPSFAKAHYSLGLLMAAGGRHDDAIAHLSAAVQSDPSYAEARLQLAEILRRRGRLREAMSHYEQVIATDPRIPDAQFGSAMTLVGLEDYRGARDRLEDLTLTYQGHPIFTNSLARLLSAAPDDGVRDGLKALAVLKTLPEEQWRIDGGEAMAMTLAELEFYDDAARWQREGMANATQAGRDDLAQRMAPNLRLYEAGKPSRTPFRDGEFP